MLDFCRSALFYIKSKIFLKYFLHDCLEKFCPSFAYKLPQARPNFNLLTIFVIIFLKAIHGTSYFFKATISQKL